MNEEATKGANEKVNPAETSNEILEDVLKQLDKLGSDKRKKILKKLAASNIITDPDIQKSEEAMSTSPKPKTVDAKKSHEIQDEVEILDLHEPKMGTYKRKRSKLNGIT